MYSDSSSPRKEPAIEQAWDTLFSLKLGLDRSGKHLSDTARRAHEKLEHFADTLTDGFLEFVRHEEARAEAMAMAKCKADRTVKLQRRVAPIKEFELRLDAAVLQAEVMAQAVYEMSEMSESLGSRRAVAALDEVEEAEEEADDGDVTICSPAKRGCDHESSVTKRFRAVTSASCSSRATTKTEKPIVAAAAAAITKHVASAPTAPNPFINPPSAYVAPSARPENERYLLATPSIPYQASLAGHVSFHTQWTLVQYLSRSASISWDDITMVDVQRLRSEDADVVLADVEARVAGTTRPRPARQRDPIAAEAAREEADIQSASYRGVGSNDKDWPYGGNIVYSITVDLADKGRLGNRVQSWQQSPPSPTNPYRSPRKGNGPSDDASNPFGVIASNRPPSDLKFTFTMQKARLGGKSFRLARRFGSRRIVAFKISSKIRTQHNVVDLFAGRVLLVMGRAYRAFWATPDGDNVFAIETGDELPEGLVRAKPPMPAFEELMAHFNDLEQKPKQAMAKWGARPQILFSDSVPVRSVEASATTVIPDVVSSCAANPLDPAAEEILTDGCGLMSATLAFEVQTRLRDLGIIPSNRVFPRPCAIQMRYGGSKGLLLLMSPEQQQAHAGKHIILRPSMIKSIPHPVHQDDPSMLMLDLLQHSTLRTGVSLYSESLVIMRHQGVPRRVFERMQDDALKDIGIALDTRPHEDETEDEARERLRVNVFQLGGVGQDWRKRRCEAEGKSLKVAGLVERRNKSAELEDDDEATSSVSNGSETSIATGYHAANQQSGLPNSPAEALYGALTAGFTSETSAFVRDMLRALVKRLTDAVVRRYRLPVKQSLSGFIVPDPTGTLGPDEIYVSFSDGGASASFIDPVTGSTMSCLTGDVLALRSPCKLPTDVRKLRAVDRPELAHLQDVIVMSADPGRCRRSPASMLGGGDYDGDTVQLFWDPDLVNAFTNADEKYAETPESFVNDNFERDLVKGDAFLQATQGQSEESRIRAMQGFLLGGLQGDALAGSYSIMHATAVFEYGVDHPESIRLARMFCHVLDARKSGLQVLESVLKRDRMKYSRKLEWRDYMKNKNELDDDNRLPAKRGVGLERFIVSRPILVYLAHTARHSARRRQDDSRDGAVAFRKVGERIERGRGGSRGAVGCSRRARRFVGRRVRRGAAGRDGRYSHARSCVLCSVDMQEEYHCRYGWGVRLQARHNWRRGRCPPDLARAHAHAHAHAVRRRHT